mmetsp:Transcript_125565/g.355215  ORF Transcript_125565/g.355215 Transcript_125565/m.355215 type:complete len:354 (-) Transcript_125565:182-1243(-)
MTVGPPSCAGSSSISLGSLYGRAPPPPALLLASACSTTSAASVPATLRRIATACALDTNRIFFRVASGIALSAIRQAILKAAGASTMSPRRRRPRYGYLSISAAPRVGLRSRLFHTVKPLQSQTMSNWPAPCLVVLRAASSTAARWSMQSAVLSLEHWCCMDMKMIGWPCSPRASTRMSPCHRGSRAPVRMSRCSCRHCSARARSLAAGATSPRRAFRYERTTSGLHHAACHEVSAPPGSSRAALMTTCSSTAMSSSPVQDSPMLPIPDSSSLDSAPVVSLSAAPLLWHATSPGAAQSCSGCFLPPKATDPATSAELAPPCPRSQSVWPGRFVHGSPVCTLPALSVTLTSVQR